jgi:hypothetical protein
MEIRVGTNINEFKRQLKKVHRKQVPFAYFQALNATAFQAMKDTRKLMRESFSKPIHPYLVKGIVYQKANYEDRKNINKMFARVDIEDFGDKGQPRRDIMRPHIDGGSRRQKKAEHLLLGTGRYFYPARNAETNRYGNLKPNQIGKAISDIGRNVDSKQNTKRKKKQFFAINTNKQRTIIMRRSGGTATPFMVEGRKPQYKKRFDFYGGVRQSVRKNFNKNMERSLRRAIKNPKK